MGKEWNNAINKNFVNQIIEWSHSMKKDYTIHEAEEFYKELGRYVCSEIYYTYDEDVEPTNK
tara:strand:- start:590 stop:775 length:186 start_codon:yes stop_codon:yes gene_type:complete